MSRKGMSKLNRAFYKVLRERLHEEQGGKCYYCHRKITRDEATLDHKIAISKCGGRHSEANSCVACFPCNAAKATGDAPVFPKPEIDPLLVSIFARMDKRTKQAEFALAFDTKGGFSKWERYHVKRGRWDWMERKS